MILNLAFCELEKQYEIISPSLHSSALVRCRRGIGGGYKLALVREHQCLERNEELVQVMEHTYLLINASRTQACLKLENGNIAQKRR
jgi:hypothetical protein